MSFTKGIITIFTIWVIGTVAVVVFGSEPIKSGYTTIKVYSVENDGERNLEDYITGYNLKIEKEGNFVKITEDDKSKVFESVILEIEEEK